MNPKNTKKSPIPKNTDANITYDFGDDCCRIADERLEKDIFVRTDFRDRPAIVVQILILGGMNIILKTSIPCCSAVSVIVLGSRWRARDDGCVSYERGSGGRWQAEWGRGNRGEVGRESLPPSVLPSLSHAGIAGRAAREKIEIDDILNSFSKYFNNIVLF